MARSSPQSIGIDLPLSWKEARSRLRDCLEKYLSHSPSLERKRAHDHIAENPGLARKWLQWDLDIYVGAFGTSLAILIIACVGFVHEESTGFGVRQSQLVAAIVMFLGFLANIWVVRRRRFSNSKGSDRLKRREIYTFLKELEKQEDELLEHSNGVSSDGGLNLAGNSLNDIQKVYRRYCNQDGTTSGGSWSRIPSLLLVHGDHIALQVGDTVPANCRLVETSKSDHRIIGAGDRITLAKFKETTTTVTANLPRGRTTLKNDSENLLTLCNNMRIFVVLETPLDTFLRQRKVESRKPQAARQLETVRARLSIVGGTIFVLTAAVLFSRFDERTDVFLALPIPFLAAIGVFPFTGPICLIFIEALGTARILASYHPVAMKRAEKSPHSVMETNMLVLRYFLATISNRLSLQHLTAKLNGVIRSLCRVLHISDEAFRTSKLVRVPPASLNLLEKLGVATAFTLVDDELVCETHAMPQQLLIPSGKGLKLLDLCPNYEDDSDGESNDEVVTSIRKDKDGDWNDSDSDSDSGLENHHHYVPSRRKRRRLLKRANRESRHGRSGGDDSSTISDDLDHDVQFEDPQWWQHLPSLKCIGLACLLVDQQDDSEQPSLPQPLPSSDADESSYKKDLVRLICAEQRRMQLRSLAKCIGFSTKANGSSEKGDITPFNEKERLHVISTVRLNERMKIDSHEIGSDESQWWGYLRPDSTSVIVQDSRTGAYQLLTVGDPRIVTRMCQQAWQGENATILPLTAHDRATILETSNGWKLGDLASTAFSYSPIPPTFDMRIRDSEQKSRKFYLLDNDPKGETLLPIIRSKIALDSEWPQLYNQIFLGVLGSPVIPRQETEGLLSTLQDAGVRFVYFSPRNMRLTKEIASQMGIDVAWNCAISLRPLDQGTEDPHRMVSNYADWDVNAKLPHGIESVRTHLQEVDNVPLLVSLFTDVTKETTMEIETFQDYNDTVIAVGLSHLPWNSRIFSTSDLAVGVDVLAESFKRTHLSQCSYNALLTSEIDFISAISAHRCAFRLRGVSSLAYMPTILAHGRASLEAATSACLFLIYGYLSFAFYIFFCVCSVSTTLPTVSIIWEVLYLQIILPLVGIPLTLSDPGKESMNRVPPKNDPAISFGKREGKLLTWVAFLKSLPPAIFPQIVYLICFGEFMIQLEPTLLDSACSEDLGQGDWALVIRCDALKGYSGVSQDMASSIALAEFIICTIVASAAFTHRTKPIFEEPPWKKNHLWTFLSLLAIAVAVLYVYWTLEDDILAVLPWYCYVLFCVMPFLCLLFVEFLKRKERRILDRAEKLRRLQFETRLGMWSPK